ncbi:MAG: hypothetical protein KDB23_01115, partial [Planctomycetales bacterium]|nr:hypothetical protein [Planctomycetales bacterium]
MSASLNSEVIMRMLEYQAVNVGNLMVVYRLVYVSFLILFLIVIDDSSAQELELTLIADDQQTAFLYNLGALHGDDREDDELVYEALFSGFQVPFITSTGEILFSAIANDQDSVSRGGIYSSNINQVLTATLPASRFTPVVRYGNLAPEEPAWSFERSSPPFIADPITAVGVFNDGNVIYRASRMARATNGNEFVTPPVFWSSADDNFIWQSNGKPNGNGASSHGTVSEFTESVTVKTVSEIGQLALLGTLNGTRTL